mgnify:CR=1 FL=1
MSLVHILIYLKVIYEKVILDTDTANESYDYFTVSYLLKNRNLFDVKAITIAQFRIDVYQKILYYIT